MRERRFWVKYQQAKIDKRIMANVTAGSGMRETSMGDTTPKFRGQPMM